MTKLGKRLAEGIAEATFRKTAEVGLENARLNLPHVKHTITELEPASPGERPESAMVISAGPSLHIHHSIQKILDSGFTGPIVAVDGSLGNCLRNGLVPDYLVSVDPDAMRIIRWFGDPHLEHRVVDEYWERQEMDPSQSPNGAEQNSELVALVDRYGPDIKMVVSTSVHPDVTTRALAAGMALYWWNPLYDDYNAPESYSRRAYDLTGAPCMVTGGNVGTSAWVFAHAILGARRVGLVGMDLGYPPERPVEKTQYAIELHALLGDHMEDAFINVYNPYRKETWFCDPAYYWYRQCFRELVRQAGCTTYNCTEGGTLFGPGIKYVSLNQFLNDERKRV